MSWITVIWSAIAGICLTLAGVHFLVWLKSRGLWANLLFSVAAASAAAVAITAGASASAGTRGTRSAAATAGGYNKGMAVFTVAKGGLMYEATIGGQKFSYNKAR